MLSEKLLKRIAEGRKKAEVRRKIRMENYSIFQGLEDPRDVGKVPVAVAKKKPIRFVPVSNLKPIFSLDTTPNTKSSKAIKKPDDTSVTYTTKTTIDKSTGEKVVDTVDKKVKKTYKT